jgi:DNA-binding SARP family transcriptional activator/tetratricopeptide (TPR) repeat protein
MTVDIRLLGGVDVGAGTATIDIGHARQRCVLAVLLVEANRAVSVEQLVDRVWGDRRLPADPANAVQTYVSLLRRAFAGVPEVAISRGSGRYTLSVDPAHVDLHRFRELVALARATDDDGAAGLLGTALALWRGDPFAGVDSAWISAMRATLVQQRQAARLDLIDLELRRGRHAEVLAELVEQGAEHPMDEGFASRRMLALYRSGRQGEALAEYRRIRRRLAEELGTEPGPALQRLHQLLLAGDPTVATATGAPISIDDAARTDGPGWTVPGPLVPGQLVPGPLVPRQLPATVAAFAGREGYLALLDGLPGIGDPDRDAEAVVIATIAGVAGVGKTALAVHWAHRLAHRFADGQIYVNLRGFDPSGQCLEPSEGVRHLLDALRAPRDVVPATVDAQSALFRSLVAGKRMLIVLDNARDSDQVRPLLPGAAGCLVIVTSRNQLTGLVAAEGAHPVALDVLSADESRELLAGRVGAARIAAEPDAVDEVVERCARLPLALAVVAARAACRPDLPLRALADQLGSGADRLDALDAGDRAADVRAVFSWSYRGLGPSAARLFRLLGLHCGPDISAAAAASLAAAPVASTRASLSELVGAGLLAEPRPGRFGFHDLLRAYARELTERVDPPRRRREATLRLLDHYLHTAHVAVRPLQPLDEAIAPGRCRPGVSPERPANYAQALAWFLAEHQVLVAAVRQAGEVRADTHARALAWALWHYFDRRGHWHDGVTTGSVEVAAAARSGGPTVRAGAHRRLARAYERLGRYAEAHTHLEYALRLCQEAGDRFELADTHHYLALLLERQGDPGAALDHTRRAHDLFRAAGHRSAQAWALNGIGWYHALLGQHTRALAYCRRALRRLEELGYRSGQADTWDSLGYAHHHLGDHGEALACYGRALALRSELGDRHRAALTLRRLGHTHRTIGDDPAARDAWHQAAVILRELDHPDLEAVLADLANDGGAVVTTG